MAMSCSPSGRVGLKIVLIKLLVSEDRFSSSLMCSKTQFWNRLWLLENMD